MYSILQDYTGIFIIVSNILHLYINFTSKIIFYIKRRHYKQTAPLEPIIFLQFFQCLFQYLQLYHQSLYSYRISDKIRCYAGSAIADLTADDWVVLQDAIILFCYLQHALLCSKASIIHEFNSTSAPFYS